MPPREFTPPTFVEKCHVVFDRRTGEIVATETRWTMKGARARRGAAVGSELLKSLAAQAGKRTGDLDVLPVRRLGPGVVAMRVDLRRRALFTKRASAPVMRDGRPGQAGSP